METVHLNLRVEMGDGSFEVEPVHAVSLGESRYQIAYSPGLVYGVAAGDEIEIGEAGTFQVLRRGGNLAIRVFSETPVEEFVEALSATIASELRGRLDGGVSKGLVFTIPVSSGFARIEAVFRGFAASRSGILWEYGNVYSDSGEPLNWWAT